jgi:hypothetical protein
MVIGMLNFLDRQAKVNGVSTDQIIQKKKDLEVIRIRELNKKI